MEIEAETKLDIARKYLDNLTDEEGRSVDENNNPIGEKLVENLMHNGALIVYGGPGNAKSTVQDCIEEVIKHQFGDRGTIIRISIDIASDVAQKHFGVHRSKWNPDQLRKFNQTYARMIHYASPSTTAAILPNRRRLLARETKEWRHMLMADTVGVGVVTPNIDVGVTTLMELAQNPDYQDKRGERRIYLRSIAEPGVYRKAGRVRNKIVHSSPEDVFYILDDEGIWVDTDDPLLVQRVFRLMGSERYIYKVSQEVVVEAEAWAQQRLLELPKQSELDPDEYTLACSIAHYKYHSRYVLNLPPERSFAVVNRVVEGMILPAYIRKVARTDFTAF